jgi:hypothetical protein
MQRENDERETNRARPEAALTPRPIRLLLFGRVRPGREREVREAQARFPEHAAAEAGIAAVEAYIGSGHYAVAFEVDTHDTQHALATCFNDPRIRDFLASLEPAVEGLPGTGWRFGASDDFHAGETGSPEERVLTTANLPLAANMYRWRAGSPPQKGEEPHGRGVL